MAIKRKDKKLKFGDVVYYSDPLHDDFEKTNLERPKLPEDYVYVNKKGGSRFWDGVVYWGLCKPLLRMVLAFNGFKIVGREKIKEAKKNGAFIYANHTSFLDAFSVQVCGIKMQRTNIIGYTDALTINKAGRFIIRHAGYYPLPTTIKDYKKFEEGMNYLVNEKHNCFVIFPEAHIWPYYTDIREFEAGSFAYPAKYNKPVIPMVSCYRKSKISKNAKITMYVLDPIYPREDLSERENKQYLRDECYKAMKKCAEEHSTYQFVTYVYKEKEGEASEEENN